MKIPLHSLLLVGLLGQVAQAELKPNALFSDHMVLQREKAVPVWGTTDPGEKVTVEFSGQSKSTVAGADGSWKVLLDPMPARATAGTLQISSPTASLSLSDVLVGDVWICSGQSNMARQLRQRPEQRPLVNGEQEIASANYPQLRQFAPEKRPMDAPATVTTGNWMVCSPETAGTFTAVGYYFGRDLHKKLGVPIGLIHSSWGGTPAEAWTRREALEAGHPEAFEAQKKATEEFPAKLAQYQQNEANLIAAWELAAQEAKTAGKPQPKKPAPPENPAAGPNRPSGLYNGMIAPLLPYAMRGVIWYQGESNASRAKQYQSLFPLMIADWRAQWGQGDFPFLFVQIAPFKGQPPEIREAQLLTWKKTANTAMVVTTDVGDADDIHPVRKEQVGQRLALAARALAYGEKLEYSGPVFESCKLEGTRAVVSFTHLGGGLVANGGPLQGFTIAGEDGRFVPAQATIEGDNVIVSAPEVPAPKHVRYGWANVPEVNLFNQAGLPASPFRSGL